MYGLRHEVEERLWSAARRLTGQPDGRLGRRRSADWGQGLSGLRVVFTVSTGRSGTGYLASIAGLLHDVEAYHEPPPNFVDVLRVVRGEGGAEIADVWLQSKVERIARCRTRTYFESSHLFCKGFFEPWIEAAGTPDLLIWSRDDRAVALSMLRLGTIPGRSDKALRWYLAPGDRGTIHDALPERFSDYQLCYWYTQEIRRRAGAYAERVAATGGRVLRLDVDALNTEDGFEKLAVFLSGRSPDRFERWRFQRLAGRRRNTKTGKGSPGGVPTDLAAQERTVSALFDA